MRMYPSSLAVVPATLRVCCHQCRMREDVGPMSWPSPPRALWDRTSEEGAAERERGGGCGRDGSTSHLPRRILSESMTKLSWFDNNKKVNGKLSKNVYTNPKTSNFNKDRVRK
jgi:hypothetical protein